MSKVICYEPIGKPIYSRKPIRRLNTHFREHQGLNQPTCKHVLRTQRFRIVRSGFQLITLTEVLAINLVFNIFSNTPIARHIPLTSLRLELTSNSSTDIRCFQTNQYFICINADQKANPLK